MERRLVNAVQQAVAALSCIKIEWRAGHGLYCFI